MAEKRVSVRLSAEGGGDVRAEFRGIGEAGDTEMRRIEQAVDRASRRLDSIGRQMQIVGAAVTVAGAAAVAAIRSNLNAADEMGKAAQSIGIPVEALSQLQYAAELSGVSISQLRNGVQRLSREMDRGSEVFERLGVQVRNASGELRPTADVLAELADRFADMEDGAEKTALAMELFGRGAGADLIPLLNAGGQAMRDMMVEADRLGITITEAMFKAAERTNDAVTRMQRAMSGLATQITTEMAPMIADLAEWVSDLVESFAALEPETQRLVASLTAITIVAGPALIALGSLLRALAAIRLAMVALVAFSGPLGVALALLTAGAAAWIAFGDNAGEAEGNLDDVRAAQEMLNEALGVFASTGAPQAGRAAIAYARNLREQALAALAAAEGELALAQARMQSRIDTAGQYVPGGWAPDPNVTNPEIEHYNSRIQELRNTIDGANRTIQGLSIQLHTAGEAAGDTEVHLGRLVVNTDELDRAMRRAGGGARQLADADLPDLSDALSQIEAASSQVEMSFERAFVSIVTGSGGAKQAIQSLLQDLSRLAAQSAFRGLAASGIFGGGGGLLEAIFGGLPTFDGGGYTGNAPRSGGLDGKGGFLTLMHPRETVIDHTRGGGEPVQVVVRIEPSGEFDARVATTSERVAVSVVGEYDRAVLPSSVRRVSSDPRRMR